MSHQVTISDKHLKINPFFIMQVCAVCLFKGINYLTIFCWSVHHAGHITGQMQRTEGTP